MTDDTVDICFRGEVEGVICPAITNMACTTEGLVGINRGAEIVDNIFLAQLLLGLGIYKLPGPVLGVVHLLGCLGMAGQAGLGYFGTILEMLIQLLKFGMVRG